jgi:ribonuclease D
MRYLQTENELNEFVSTVLANPPAVMAIDLEGESNRHRYGFHVCLFQFFFQGESVLVDSLSIRDVGPLERIIAHPDIRKVAYATDFDVRLVHLVYGWRFQNLYDVQLAAKELGHEEIALPFLLKHYLGLDFVKNNKLQRSNWNLRPLTEEHLEYAALDVWHLLDLYEAMHEQIQSKGLENRLAARNRAAEGHRFQARHRPWLSVKGSGTLNRDQKIVLKHLFEAREKTARLLDHPPYWVIPNEKIIELSALPPAHEQEWKNSGFLSTKAKAHAAVFHAACEAARQELIHRSARKKID